MKILACFIKQSRLVFPAHASYVVALFVKQACLLATHMRDIYLATYVVHICQCTLQHVSRLGITIPLCLWYLEVSM
jgi:hypothetical protein